jgi:2-amino-4-hydroxy-6-hydroxymethyldihydropteridine diphosphokinase
LLSPTELLSSLLSIENLLGRIRKEKWGSREIDIDILFFGSQVIETNELKVPHPSIADRRFTLVPLVEIAPNFIHPITKKTCSELLHLCSDLLEVKPYRRPKDF